VGYLVGTDEAGYGPNLGPLVISATVWQVPDTLRCGDLAALLADVIVSSPAQIPIHGRPCVAIGDSKVLYQSGKGLQHLERGLWAAMALLGHEPGTWREVWQLLAPEAIDHQRAAPWHADYDTPVPLDINLSELPLLVAALADAMGRRGVRLAAIRSRAIFPDLFNRLVRQHGSKGSALSSVTLDLAAEVMAPLEAGPITVICDKHGGRNRYRDLLAASFPDCLVEVYAEGRDSSFYRFGPRHRRVEFRFEAKAEAYLPTALASMASKYLRELAMRAWNQFWCSRVAGLRPTAGYPEDARRFRDEIAVMQAELGISDELTWRER
jgi:hypothetical protein